MGFAWQAPPVRQSAAVHQLPEEVGRVRVGVAGFGGLETGVQTDHQQHEAWSDAVDEIVDRGVRVGGSEGVAGVAAFDD